MDKNYSSEKMPKGMQKLASISDKLNKTNRSFLEQQARMNEMIVPFNSAIEKMNAANLVTEKVMNSIEMASIPSVATQFQFDGSGNIFNGLTQATEIANRLTEPIGSFLPSFCDNVSEISTITSTMAQLNTENLAADSVIRSMGIGVITSMAAQLQLNVSGINFNGLTQAIETANHLTEPLGNLLSSFCHNDGEISPIFYNWYHSIDFTNIADALRNQAAMMSSIANVSITALYNEYEEIIYQAKWFPGAIFITGLKIISELQKIVLSSKGMSKRCEKRIDKVIEAFFTKTEIKRIKYDWKNSDFDSVIIKILGQALESYLRGEYALTITALAPLWEGLIHKKTHVTSRQKSELTNKQFQKLVSENDFNDICGDYYVNFIMHQCNGVDNIIEGVPNRHSFAHGWYNKYPTKKAALNAILFTDFIIKLEPKDINRDS